MLLGYYTETMQDDKYQELKKFRVAYKYRSHEDISAHRILKQRQKDHLICHLKLMKLKCFIRSPGVKTSSSQFGITGYLKNKKPFEKWSDWVLLARSQTESIFGVTYFLTDLVQTRYKG
ncbi:hypothetical protein KUTeg_009106 [Tegillarca granosa]|uniref:Uncharacterized protein n=1 Tax=Tegillarca granosa TaxID=220873 RepID=A0ABQ9FCE8_TEGGR|nr:hypothetical protein KUTeg_009106 [Tegillarca granosa]